MSLSEHEQRVLASLERELSIEDPSLARQLESGKAKRGLGMPWSLNVIAVVSGVLLVIMGGIERLGTVGFLGVLLMLGGVLGLCVDGKRSEGRRRPWGGL
ncbi:MAG TPA: DUF3040 domain-containing protein [Arthrobacter sp.]|nr:DUF3040 domain-containing protein [Arthrobacter sp.]